MLFFASGITRGCLTEVKAIKLSANARSHEHDMAAFPQRWGGVWVSWLSKCNCKFDSGQVKCTKPTSGIPFLSKR